MAKIKIKNKKIIIAVALGFLIIFIGMVVWIIMSSSGKKEELQTVEPVETIQIAAQDYVGNNDIDGGLEYYDDQLSKRQDNDEKKTILIYKSSFALDAKRYDIAVEAAKQADEMGSNIGTVEALAQAYEAEGNKELAIVYYKKAIEISPKEGMGARYNPIWQEKIAELEK